MNRDSVGRDPKIWKDPSHWSPFWGSDETKGKYTDVWVVHNLTASVNYIVELGVLEGSKIKKKNSVKGEKQN